MPILRYSSFLSVISWCLFLFCSMSDSCSRACAYCFSRRFFCSSAMRLAIRSFKSSTLSSINLCISSKSMALIKHWGKRTWGASAHTDWLPPFFSLEGSLSSLRSSFYSASLCWRLGLSMRILITLALYCKSPTSNQFSTFSLTCLSISPFLG